MARLASGALYGPYEVIRLTEDATQAVKRLYEVVTHCCGERVVRNEKVLKQNAAFDRTLCLRCTAKRNGERQVRVMPGERFGMVQLVEVLSRGTYGRFRVQWDCCGKVTEVNGAYLYLLRNAARREGPERLCRDCYLKVHRGEALRSQFQPLQPTDFIAPAVAWARPESLRVAP